MVTHWSAFGITSSFCGMSRKIINTNRFDRVCHRTEACDIQNHTASFLDTGGTQNYTPIGVGTQGSQNAPVAIYMSNEN